jgi:tRNA A-37 threonylcarbamoyl transferase component Bud32
MPVLMDPSRAQFESDPGLPGLPRALDPEVVGAALAERLRIGDATGVPRVTFVRVVAYKPGRRCLIEYQIEVPTARGTLHLTLLGKMRVNRYGNSGYRQLRSFWEAGFDDRSADGISVPEPVATVPALNMWLQRKVDGEVATALLAAGPPRDLAQRIARAVHKLHACGVTPDRRHTIDDELRILDRTLPEVSAARHDLAPRIGRLLNACGRLGGLLRDPVPCGSHRDFYADQVIVSAGRLYLIDFDLYCDADPGLDVGNFIGHVTEHSLRVRGDADALAGFERELEDAFVGEAGEDVSWAVRVYTALTIARHVYLSTRVAGRVHLTEALLHLAERRVLEAAADGGHA